MRGLVRAYDDGVGSDIRGELRNGVRRVPLT
jgi:hypothetical protein